jgi:beta-galactosidase
MDSKTKNMIMRKISAIFTAMVISATAVAQSQRSKTILKEWEFRHGHETEAVEGWEKVSVPHDWAIYGPFDKSHDLQTVAVVQNGENVATEKTGRTGGLPYMGKGSYRRILDIPAETLDGRRHILLFDGAMSEAQVYVNGEKVCFWPYGYNSFHCDITGSLKEGANELTVLLENRPQSSRWYPGAGLYRKVRHITLPKVHVPVWGTYVTTPYIGEDYAIVNVRTKVEGVENGTVVTVRTRIVDSTEGYTVAASTDTRPVFNGEVEQNITVESPMLWSPENPELYYACTEIRLGGSIDTAKDPVRPAISVKHGSELQDKVCTRFGFRTIEIRPDKGFFLNGQERKIRGVCLHHDLGPLGAAINKAAIRRQLTILKDMGCDAIRTSHNMPAEELIELCDEMGFMVMCENFDEWDIAKCQNGYHRFFNEDSGNGTIWAERDMINMLHHFRNNASVVMWSIGNEVPSQWKPEGVAVAGWLQDLCHKEDPTRPVTCGMDQYYAVTVNGFAEQLDIVGYNYKIDRYIPAYEILPQRIILGSETASTVSSRGVYHFPVKIGHDILNDDHQSSSYDTEYCLWSNIPDNDFAADEDYPWCIGQFVWTGFDYLGEPSPYDTDAWPNHSSVFGIVDLASIPKDRYYLYRSQWNKNEHTLHVLPHWNWEGREGEVTPVFVYTSYPSAELFVNGISQGMRTFAESDGKVPCLGEDAMKRFRLMWNEVVYQPGELKVVAYDAEGNPAEEKVVRTAGKAYAVKLTPDRSVLKADGEDLCYLNVSLVDKDGNPVPADSRLVNVKVSGAGSFKAIANGDPTCLEPFQKPQMHLFSGQLTVLVQSSETPGEITVEVSGKGVRKAELKIKTE